jgi:2-iminobutanoate/2-iminopropanoate deaminase
MQFITIENAKPNPGHYSPAVRAGNLIFISGQLPIDVKTGEKCTGDIVEQTRQILRNLDQLLMACAIERKQIAKTTLFVADMNDWDTINEIYSLYFGEHKPARSIVPTKALHHGFGIELEAIACLD